MTRLPTSEADSGVAASLMCTVNVHWSGAILRRSGNRTLHWSSRKHLMCWNKYSSKFCGRWSGCMVVCHTSVRFYEGLVCFLVLKYPLSSFIPSLWSSEVRSTISEQCNLILECRVKSASEFDHNGLVIVILVVIKYNELSLIKKSIKTKRTKKQRPETTHSRRIHAPKRSTHDAYTHPNDHPRALVPATNQKKRAYR